MDNAENVKLEFVGSGVYKSVDHITNQTISVKTGDIITASSEKAAQILKDFPASWNRIDDKGRIVLDAEPSPLVGPDAESQLPRPAAKKKAHSRK